MATRKAGVAGKLGPMKAVGSMKDMWVPAAKLPTKIGDCIDLFVAAYHERKRREAEVQAVKVEEDRIEDHIIKCFGKQDIEGAKGRLGSVVLKEKDVPKIKDFEAFCKYVKANDAWDLFQRRPGEAACQARWENNEEVPGIEKFHVKSVRLSEAK